MAKQKGGFKPFERSPKDKEVKGMKEHSPKEKALDRRQMGKKPMFGR